MNLPMRKRPEQTEQTETDLKQAFWKLYAAKPIEQITVSEVAQLAGYNRGTFYLHVQDIYDVLNDLMAATGCTEDEAWNKIYRGGLSIYSTENSVLQQICEDEANNPDLYPTDAQVSIVLIDTETGQVKAMVGGRGQKTASLILNRATSTPRQPGSAIKIIGEYAAGLDQGEITLGTIFDDAPYTYSDGTEVQNADGSYGGRMTVRSAIIRSNNIVALKTFQQMGIDTVWNELNSFGISTLAEEDRVEALALGGMTNGVTNLELTAAY